MDEYLKTGPHGMSGRVGVRRLSLFKRFLRFSKPTTRLAVPHGTAIQVKLPSGPPPVGVRPVAPGTDDPVLLAVW